MKKRLVIIQRILGGAIAYIAAVVFGDLGIGWYWLPIMFVLYDISIGGYIKNPTLGAAVYNVGHSFLFPGALLVLGFMFDQNTALLFISSTWLFHIGVDRALGYGLKTPQGFRHTDLGDI